MHWASFVGSSYEVGVENISLLAGSGKDNLQSGSATDTLISVDFVQFSDQTRSFISLGVAPTGSSGIGSLASTSGNDTLIGTEGNDTLFGLGGDDVLQGLLGDDYLDGGDDNDTLRGGAGNDTLIGGAGNDSYFVDSAGDVVTEGLGGGTDTVNTSLLSYTLSANVEKLIFIGSGNFAGTGNALNNVITGGAGNDTVRGGAGADTLIGLAGNDTYFVDNSGDLVSEASGAGSDTVKTTLLSYTLGANVEKLTFTGAGNFAGTGNTLNNTITGGAGNDTLRGGIGADTLIGGAGGDAYYVDNPGDVVSEASSAGIDTVNTSLGGYTLGANVEKLTFTGAGSFSGTGNGLNNRITGGSGSDTLRGGTGADTLIGLAGSDVYYLDNSGDVVTEASGAGSDTVNTSLARYVLGANIEMLTFIGGGNFTGLGNGLANTITGGGGIDTLKGSAGNDTLNGSGGDDTLHGGLGNDSLTGGAGNDSYRFDTALGAANVDRIFDFSSVNDRILLSQSVFTAAGPVGTLAAGAFFIGAGAHDADDRVIYNNGTGALSYDPDGTGGAGQTQFATLPTGLASTLTAANFENIVTLPLLYHLQNADYGSLSSTGFRIGVIDMDDAGLGTSEVALLQGQDKIIVTYLSIGEAENYRAYWQDGGWDASPPDFLLGENPIWPGNYSVKFWDPDWQAIIFARVDEAINLGYNGMYLDIVDAYTVAQVQNAYPGTTEELRQEMIDFVTALSQYAKAQQPGFLVVPQNAVGLLAANENDPSIPNVAYLQAIDGLGVESLWYSDDDVADWTDSDLVLIQHALDANKFVLATSYPTEDIKQETFITNALNAGLIPFAAERSLIGIIDPANNAIEPAMANLDINAPWATPASLAAGLTADGGGAGNDTLNGGTGNDSLTVGIGQDSFLFDTALGAADVVQLFDFNSVNDTIRLSSSIFTTAGPVGVLAPSAFVETPAGAETGSSRIIYDSTTGQLSYDSDGTGGSSTATQLATLPTGLTLTNANFEIV